MAGERRPRSLSNDAELGAFDDISVAANIGDSTGGADDISAAAAGLGDVALSFKATLPTGGTDAAEIVTTFTPGFKFKVKRWAYIEDVAATGTSGSRVYNMEIGSTDVGSTPSTVTITTASAAVGRVIAGTAVAGANEGSASDTLSIEVAAGGTTHDAGSGTFVVVLQNMDVADAIATLLAGQKAAGQMTAD
jgi:hypothetical protein